jgi:arylsulfatase A-like enzyme
MNIILITLDAFNYGLFVDNIGSLPNLARLKETGVSFENAFSVGANTAFAFPGILAGVYPYYFGTMISKNIRTIDSVLKDYIYNTAFINESNALLTPFFGYGRGLDFQEHFLSLSHAAIDRKRQDSFLKGTAPRMSLRRQFMRKLYGKLPGQQIRSLAKQLYQFTKLSSLLLRANSESLRERRILHNTFRDRIVRFINQEFREPQFLWIHTIINHLPYLPPEESNKFTEREVNYLNYRGLSGLLNPRICERLKALYVESLRKTDQLLGEVIDSLNANDLLHDTLVIVTADHGEEFEKKHFGHSPESSSDSLLHVPLVFSGPSRFTGKSISTPVSTIDILPSIADMAGLQIPRTARGVSLKNLIVNPTDPGGQSPARHRALYSEAWDVGSLLKPKLGTESSRTIFTVRHGRHKLKVIEKTMDDVISTELQLMDWIENKELDIQTNGKLVDRLRSLLYRHLYEEGVFYQTTVGEKERIRRKVGKFKKIEGQRNLH